MTQQTSPPDDLVTRLFNDLRNIAGILGVIAGICYVLGYLIVNIYLNKFNAAHLSLLQARYVTTGIIFIILNSLTFIGPFIISMIWQQEVHQKGKKKWWHLPGLLIFGILSSCVIIWVSGILLTELDRSQAFVNPLNYRKMVIWIALPASQLALLFPFVVNRIALQASHWLVIKRARPASSLTFPQWALQTIMGGLFVLCFLISLYVFASYVYPNMTSSLGGGAPIRVQLLLSGNTSLDVIHVKSSNGLTEPLTLIDQSNNKLLLLNDQNEVIELSLQEVQGLIHSR